MTPAHPTNTQSGREAAPLRGDVYALLAALLAGPPVAGRLEQVRALGVLPGLPASLERSVGELRTAALRTTTDAADREYNALFVGLGRGEVVPYASWYAEKTLVGTPLVRLRRDLAALKIERRSETGEPEDHAAALCEAMMLLTAETVPDFRAAAFFKTHLAPWLPAFFNDLQKAPAADFYRAVGRLGEVFMGLENERLQDQYHKEEDRHETLPPIQPQVEA